ncbi:MAG TPA: hypothetical protein VFN51_01635 [Candidatus Saccharimonadales bacterium]|nr:hypothetical protein [Candidatus Saccharimonadales bacterium]
MFSQSDEQYISYLQRITNKGVTTESQLGEKEVKELLHKLVSEGFCSNGSTRYRLTTEGVRVLVRDTQKSKPVKEKTVQPELESLATDDAKEQNDLFIKPLDLPRLPNGDLDLVQIEADRKTASRFGYRCLEILAELELSGGVITAPPGRLSNAIRILADADVGSDSYKKSFDKLQNKGFIDINADGSTLRLTADGEKIIALLKSHSEELKEEAPQRIWASTSFHIIELVLRETGLALEPNTKPEDLPDSTDWLLARNSTISLIPRIALALDLSEDTAVRRLFDMRKTKGYVEVMEMHHAENDRPTITNIRVLRKGLEFALMAQQMLRKREQVLDEIEVEEVQELIDGCLHLAECLGETKLYDQLKRKYAHKSMFELTNYEFTKERASLETLFENLRRDYIFENSRSLAA